MIGRGATKAVWREGKRMVANKCRLVICVGRRRSSVMEKCPPVRIV